MWATRRQDKLRSQWDGKGKEGLAEKAGSLQRWSSRGSPSQYQGKGATVPTCQGFGGGIFLAIQAFAETADGWKDFREGAISLPLHFYQGAFTLFPPLTVVKRENAGRAARRLGSCRLAFSARNQLCPLVNRSASFASMCPFVKPVGPCSQDYFNGCTFFFFLRKSFFSSFY